MPKQSSLLSLRQMEACRMLTLTSILPKQQMPGARDHKRKDQRTLGKRRVISIRRKTGVIMARDIVMQGMAGKMALKSIIESKTKGIINRIGLRQRIIRVIWEVIRL